MTRTAVLGLPRVGPDRELKFAQEAYWAGEGTLDQLTETADRLRTEAWKRAEDAGIDVIPCGDSSLYDQMLDMSWALGAVPSRFGRPEPDDLDGYFAMARGTESVKPLEMTKWFDTNYHYLVPELEAGREFDARPGHWVHQLELADSAGIAVRPVLIGPATFLALAKGPGRDLARLEELTAAYARLLAALADAGATEIQIDEPILVTDLDRGWLDGAIGSLTSLAGSTTAELSVATYFAGLDLDDRLERLAATGIDELHLDLVRAPEQLAPAVEAFAASGARLSLGLLDGRNVWIADLDAALGKAETAIAALGGDRVTIAPSCSLLHVPYEAAREHGIDPEVRGWLAFAAERLAELDLLRRAVEAGPDGREELLAASREAIAARHASPHTNDPAVRERVAGLRPADFGRSEPYPERRAAQRRRVELPELPTTTIGSYPQTEEIRAARRRLRAGEMTESEYDTFLEGQIAEVIAYQEGLGLDVLVHGEPERNDMVEYFGQRLDGFAFSENGWVTSYGSRCVKPPILFGDVSRPDQMTVRWWSYSQSLSERPVKGMLTGPVTILQWSFVRDDQPDRDTCLQIALAIQDEVVDLEAAGAFAIQVDEAALREGLPLQHRHQDDYVRWAVDCFRLTVAPAAPETQVHSHMCYSEFNEMMEHIVRLDADVLSIEASRSGMEVLDAFLGELSYPNEIGPGIYDIHSPRVPSVDEIEELLAEAERRIGRERLWVNPDCGLKTRRWEEVRPALEHMVAATERRRAATSPASAGDLLT